MMLLEMFPDQKNKMFYDNGKILFTMDDSIGEGKPEVNRLKF